MSVKFSMGMMIGLMAGIALSAVALDQMRPDVTARMVKNGRRMVNHYRKMCM